MGEDQRLEAVQRFERGESATDICRALQRPRSWLYKWLKRKGELTGEPKPVRAHNRTTVAAEQAVIAIRQALAVHPYAQMGVNAIKQELHRQKLPCVSPATIDRIIKRAGLVRKPKSQPYAAKGKAYPKMPALGVNSIHQADLVGPRYIKGDGRFYSLNAMDIFTHRVCVHPCRRKRDEQVTQGLIRTWQELGIPDFLQVDNELCFRGSNRYPRSLGLVLRLCLSLEIQPVFIPPREPWRNGEIENFQKTFDAAFYRSQFYPSFKELCGKAREFEHYHNEHYIYQCLQHQTPLQVFHRDPGPIAYLPASFQLPDGPLPIENGYIHFMRFIRSDQRLVIFGESFHVSKDLIYEYIKATICTETHTLQVRLDDQLVHSFEYRLPYE